MTMFTRHLSRRLAAYIDGELTPREARRADLHLEGCAACRDDRERVRFGMGILEQLPRIEAPEAVWLAIEARLRQPQSTRRFAIGRWRLAFATTVALSLSLLIGTAAWRLVHQSGTRWEVLRLEGAPSVGARHLTGAGRIGVGEWVETDSGSRAAVKIGEIGSVEIAPNTRLRIVAARPQEHRLALARGGIQARISAPPRLFFVETASGTAVDLGCEYTLNSDEEGFGLLRVTRGWVSFQWNGLESLVPAGASCQTRPHAGPGVPYFDDATEDLKEALARFDLSQGGGDVSAVLAASRARDTLTLWHLLSRVAVEERARVYDRIAALTPVPAGVSRENALKLDGDTLRRWKEELAWTW